MTLAFGSPLFDFANEEQHQVGDAIHALTNQRVGSVRIEVTKASTVGAGPGALGWYYPDDGVISLFTDRLPEPVDEWSRNEVRHTLAHEMVHALQHQRWTGFPARRDPYVEGLAEWVALKVAPVNVQDASPSYVRGYDLPRRRVDRLIQRMGVEAAFIHMRSHMAEPVDASGVDFHLGLVDRDIPPVPDLGEACRVRRENQSVVTCFESLTSFAIFRVGLEPQSDGVFDKNSSPVEWYRGHALKRNLQGGMCGEWNSLVFIANSKADLHHLVDRFIGETGPKPSQGLKGPFVDRSDGSPVASEAHRRCLSETCTWSWVATVDVEEGQVLSHTNVEFVPYPSQFLFEDGIRAGQDPKGRAASEPILRGHQVRESTLW